MAKRDFYEVLGISRSAEAAEVKRAHRKLARKFHPDVNKDDPKAAERFGEVQEAYEVLSNPEKRKLYDQFGPRRTRGRRRTGRWWWWRSVRSLSPTATRPGARRAGAGWISRRLPRGGH